MTSTTTAEMDTGWRNTVFVLAAIVSVAVGLFSLLSQGPQVHWLFFTAAGVAMTVVGVAKALGQIG